MRRAQRIRQREETDRDLMLAWWVERISLEVRNTNKLPPLETYLRRGRKAVRQSPQEQRAVLHILSEQYGIPLKVKSA